MDLFDHLPSETALTPIAPGAVLLHGFARAEDATLLQAIESVLQQAPCATGKPPVAAPCPSP